jgi:hypothetical protein
MKKKIDKKVKDKFNNKRKPFAWIVSEEEMKKHKASWARTRDGMS